MDTPCWPSWHRHRGELLGGTSKSAKVFEDVFCACAKIFVSKMRGAFKNCWSYVQQSSFVCQKDAQTKRFLAIGRYNTKVYRKIRERVDYNDTANQKIHQWVYGKLLKMLEEKAKIVGIKLVYVNEAYTSKTCPVCGKQNIVKDRRYKCECGFEYHRDGVGAINIFKRYRGKSHVVGVLASPVGVRFKPHLRSLGVSTSPWKPAVSW